ncbi:Hpt domain-containing protein [Cecembia calidifontis]|jgi:HPt (histidine-containing phosphotransfer) domain-containing protein|uniref:HPt (Histidine-containing phosphotransfer) domain-containing protein n=1 Tax=Cecembia calidifontis TaxID=1187080 RepID=A0A4Q7PCJ0_9BACT|nr:Hpt domain-containing protein [Cecembia calidifontis]RZS97428.1 HPt (histidine-containing phosphotransfer) domain-containing protein [Cecembia calidifontis]
MYKLISPQTIIQYFGDDDKEMLQEMVQIIIDTNLHDLKYLDEFYDAKDFATIKKKCHKAKPSMSYVGAVDTRKLLEKIEADLENSRPTYKKLREHVQIIDEELKKFLENL